MADLNSRNRLRPSLLELLQSDLPAVMDEEDLRRYVVRDLEWLFNTTGNSSLVPQDKDAGIDAYPNVAASVLNYGLPGMTGGSVARLDRESLQRALRQVLARFEPRILQQGLKVQLDPGHDALREGTLAFEIEGRLRLDKRSVPIRLRTEVDVGTSAATVIDKDAGE
jgi:type VI secretion system protein ImpF